jgi:predicted DNA-binding protein
MMVCGCSTPKRMAVQLPAATVEALQRLAKQRGCTISDVLRESICKESEVEGK